MSPASTLAVFPVGVLLQPAVEKGAATSAPSIATVARRRRILMGGETSTRTSTFREAPSARRAAAEPRHRRPPPPACLLLTRGGGRHRAGRRRGGLGRGDGRELVGGRQESQLDPAVLLAPLGRGVGGDRVVLAVPGR